MGLTHRQYRSPDDFKLVGDFLIANYQPGNRDGNWLQPTWEYMHSHSTLDELSLDKIRIWEESDEIVAVVHYESTLGEVFFQNHPEHTYLKPAMLEYAENHLYGETEAGERYVRAFVNDFDQELEALVKSRGYEMAERYARPVSEFVIPRMIPVMKPPEGFLIILQLIPLGYKYLTSQSKQASSFGNSCLKSLMV